MAPIDPTFIPSPRPGRITVAADGTVAAGPATAAVRRVGTIQRSADGHWILRGEAHPLLTDTFAEHCRSRRALGSALRRMAQFVLYQDTSTWDVLPTHR